MRSKMSTRLAMLLTAAVLVVSVAGAGVRSAGSGRRAAPDLPSSPDHQVALAALSDCDEMRAYLSEVIVETIVGSRYGSGWWNLPWAGPEDGLGSGPGDFTTTNNQEEGVDELDIVKTDGNFLYVVREDELLIVDSWPAENAEMLSRTELGGQTIGLFLYGDNVLVVSTFWESGNLAPRYWVGTRIDVVDVSDRSAPQVVRTVEVEGMQVGSRMIDGHVYLMLNSWMDIPIEAWQLIWRDDLGLPVVDWDAPEEEREAAAELARTILRPLVEAIVAELELTDMVPLLSDTAAGSDPAPLLACDELYRTAEPSAYSVLAVLHLDLNDDGPVGGEIHASGVLADGWTVYASAETMYVAQTSRWWWWGLGELEMTTAIHAFELNGDEEDPVRYTASGEVPGWVLNQFSMSEHEGYLRVASTLFDWWWGTTEDEEDRGSLVTVLSNDGEGEFVEVGQVNGIAPGEQIYAARFMADKGYLVTFEVVDPLFTLDLSDPTDPQVVGMLKVPGFSSYLHPMGEDHLLAVGMDGNDDGTINGLAVSVFDVSDFELPTEVYHHVIEGEDGAWSWSEALADHHAFTFHRDVLSIPAYISDGEQHFSGLIVMSVDLEDGVSELGRIDHQDLPHRPDGYGGWYVAMRRSVYIEDFLLSLSSRGLKVNDLYNPAVFYTDVPFY